MHLKKWDSLEASGAIDPKTILYTGDPVSSELHDKPRGTELIHTIINDDNLATIKKGKSNHVKPDSNSDATEEPDGTKKEEKLTI